MEGGTEENRQTARKDDSVGLTMDDENISFIFGIITFINKFNNQIII